jgi:hypothetical protein
MNNYASWYLNGVTNRAEYGADKNTNDNITTFSGPIQKLFPQAIQEEQRIESIMAASEQTTFSDTEGTTTGSSAPQVTDVQNHNQIVVCSDKSILGMFGQVTPHACYSGGGSAAQDVYRLKDWDDGSLSGFNTFFNWLGTDIWNKRYPPLPWQFDSEVMYHKAYNEWRGKTCAILPVIGLQCIDNPGVSNEWSDLFPYVPLASTADKNAKMPIYTVTIQAPQSPLVSHSYVVVQEPVHFYPHTQEVKDLSASLNETYIPKEGTNDSIPSDSTENNSKCRTVNVRSNPGDDLFPVIQPADIRITASWHVQGEVPCQVHFIKINPITGVPEEWSSCTAEVYIGIHTDPVKVPFANDIWKTTVAGSESTFRRIYPKVETGAPVSCIADIPSVTNAVYTPVEGTSKIGVEGPLGSPDKTNMDPENAKIYFPHFGSVLDYFLKGIQTALRPKDFADPNPISGRYCTNNIKCGELPELPKASGSCNVSGISPRIGSIPQSLKDIISAAAETYKTPPNLILAEMYGEGLFNPGRYDWTDENVKNWATCEKIPDCNETGDDNFMGFNGNDFQNIVPYIKGDIQKLDPNRIQFSQCNLLDTIYAASWNLHNSADGGGPMAGMTCYGINLQSTVPTSCDWPHNEQYESAIKVYESGYTDICMTAPGGCAAGGMAAACPSGDTCEQLGGSGNTSHNACVWEVAHGR